MGQVPRRGLAPLRGVWDKYLMMSKTKTSPTIEPESQDTSPSTSFLFLASDYVQAFVMSMRRSPPRASHHTGPPMREACRPSLSELRPITCNALYHTKPFPASAGAHSPGSGDVLASAHPNEGKRSDFRVNDTGDLADSSGSRQGMVTQQQGCFRARLAK